MDFVHHNTLADGRSFLVLTAEDNWSRQSPVPDEGRLSGATCSQTLDWVLTGVSGPRSITVDRDTELQSWELEDWAYRRGVQLNFIRSGKPVRNDFIEPA